MKNLTFRLEYGDTSIYLRCVTAGMGTLHI
jgi:hypothetical protein